jgi:hypothetical protein
VRARMPSSRSRMHCRWGSSGISLFIRAVGPVAFHARPSFSK